VSDLTRFGKYAAGHQATDDKHQRALYRLAALAQYLYDTMAGDAESDRPEPMPQMAMECVREAQRQIDLAIKHGQRTRRECLGGHLELVEQLGDWVNESAA
jgi:hypothetical protein